MTGSWGIPEPKPFRLTAKLTVRDRWDDAQRLAVERAAARQCRQKVTQSMTGRWIVRDENDHRERPR